MLGSVRSHRASFSSVCPDLQDAFESWWRGEPPAAGRHSILVFFDPEEGRRSDRRRWIGLMDSALARAKYRGYADAMAQLGYGD